MSLYPHQKAVLANTRDLNRVAYYLDMGLGKTYVGAEKMRALGARVNLLICQKSKIEDWKNHILEHFDYAVHTLSTPKELEAFMSSTEHVVGIINYELAWRRKELLNLANFTLMLDESSLIQNDKAKQTKFVLKLKPANVVLLSGTPVSGKYENLWTQAHLLGWPISRDVYDATYINWTLTPPDRSGMRHRIVDRHNPYKNVDRLNRKLREYGAVFMKTDEVLTLPEQVINVVQVGAPKGYYKFIKNDIVEVDGVEIIAKNILTKRLGCKKLTSTYNVEKYRAVRDLLDSTKDRVIIFYCFTEELNRLIPVCGNRPISIVNGDTKDLTAYEEDDTSVTLIQYQAGAMGLNLQLCNRIIYFSLPERSDLFEQSKKRIHRIGTKMTCFYTILLAKDTIDGNIYDNLLKKCDYTDDLFKKDIAICKK